jgi:hypothetical protein
LLRARLGRKERYIQVEPCFTSLRSARAS